MLIVQEAGISRFVVSWLPRQNYIVYLITYVTDALTSNPAVGAKVLMAPTTIADLLKLHLPVTKEHPGHIRANIAELLEGGAGRGSGDIPGSSLGYLSTHWQ